MFRQQDAFRFDVAFSFAGPHREKVRAVAELVSAKLGREKVFYDDWYKHEILGDDMDVLLQSFYHEESLMVVADLSEEYAGRPWCRAEARAIRALRFNLDPARDQTGRLRLLNARFGDGEVPGVFKTTAYLDGVNDTPEQCAELILKRHVLLVQRMAGKPKPGLAQQVISSHDHPSPALATPPISFVQNAKEREGKPFDFFISHAWEDKASQALPLASALKQRGYKVWIDHKELTIGDSLRTRIDEGLDQSHFGVVILSRSFFQKHWTKSELDGLHARAIAAGEKVILPIWHDIDEQYLIKVAPMLAGLLAARTSEGSGKIADQIVRAYRATFPIAATTNISITGHVQSHAQKGPGVSEAKVGHDPTSMAISGKAHRSVEKTSSQPSRGFYFAISFVFAIFGILVWQTGQDYSFPSRIFGVEHPTPEPKPSTPKSASATPEPKPSTPRPIPATPEPEPTTPRPKPSTSSKLKPSVPRTAKPDSQSPLEKEIERRYKDLMKEP